MVTPGAVRRGDVYTVELNPARGREAEPAHLFRPLNTEGV